MYTLNNGEVAYDYTPGWFDGILIDEMTLTWHDPAGVTGVASEGDTQNGEHILTASSMGYGDKLPLTVTYADWPTALDSQYSRENIPEDYNNGSYYEGDRSLGDTFATVIGFIIMIAIICFVVSVLTSIGRYAGASVPAMCLSMACGTPRGPGAVPGPAVWAPRHGPARPRAVGRAASAAVAGAAALAAAASAAAATVPVPAAAPVPVPVPAPAAAGPAAVPRISTEPSTWIRIPPKN